MSEIGVPTYKWGAWPEHLLTKKQMCEAGFSVGKTKLPAPAGKVRRSKSPGGIMWLYDRNDGVPKKTLTPEQKAHLDKAREKSLKQWQCSRCGGRLSRRGRKLCYSCTMDDKFAADREHAVHTATALLHAENTIILDTETADLHGEIIEIGIIDGKTGEVLLDSLVKPDGKVAKGAYDVHGIDDAMLVDAPTWGELYPQVYAVMRGKTVMIYNADYDMPLIREACELHYAPEIPVQGVVCLMALYAEWHGDWSEYHRSYRWLPLNGGHRAIGDCQAARRLLMEMAV